MMQRIVAARSKRRKRRARRLNGRVGRRSNDYNLCNLPQKRQF